MLANGGGEVLASMEHIALERRDIQIVVQKTGISFSTSPCVLLTPVSLSLYLSLCLHIDSNLK